MKKTLLVIALFSLSFSLKAQYAWVSQATGFTQASTGIRNVSAVDSNVLWISTYDGSGGGANRTDFSRTVDGGATWVPGATGAPSGYNWSMIHAHNADTAWAMFYNAVAQTGGGIYFTGDGGVSWVLQDSINGDPVNTIFNASSFPDIVYFWDDLQGLSIGDPNAAEFEIYTSVDAGNSWTPVDTANIPNPLAGEYAIVDHYSVIGNTLWFDTNKGRVYKSTDKGLTWTVSSTGITVGTSQLDICFYDLNNGLARLYDAVSGTNTVKTTADGGTTWNTATINGQFFGSDVAYIPGTTAKLISTGVDFTNGFIGSSFSDDGGLNWTTFETIAQRTAIGVVDSNHMWVGGFSSTPLSDGIFKYTYFSSVACNDPAINAGVTASTATYVCPDDTVLIYSSGVFSPNNGDFSGVSWVVSTVDISGTTDPLNDPNVVIIYTFNSPAPAISSRQFINNGSLIGPLTNNPYGVYFWTPIVFGNATDNPNDTITNPFFLTHLILDPACTYGGTSISVEVLDVGSPLCSVGIPENDLVNLSVSAYFNNLQTLNLTINAAKNEKASVRIFDIAGREVYSLNETLAKGTSTKTINAQNFGAGFYYVQVETANQKAVTKIVKQ